MNYLRLYENFISSTEFLQESDWKKYVPDSITIDKGKETGTFKLRDNVKNLNSIDLSYYLDTSSTETMSNNLHINISFKLKNHGELPLIANTFEATVEITLGNLYVFGVKVIDNKVLEFIERQATINSGADKKLCQLINYISGDTLKIKTLL